MTTIDKGLLLKLFTAVDAGESLGDATQGMEPAEAVKKVGKIKTVAVSSCGLRHFTGVARAACEGVAGGTLNSMAAQAELQSIFDMDYGAIYHRTDSLPADANESLPMAAIAVSVAGSSVEAIAFSMEMSGIIYSTPLAIVCASIYGWVLYGFLEADINLNNFSAWFRLWRKDFRKVLKRFNWEESPFVEVIDHIVGPYLSHDIPPYENVTTHRNILRTLAIALWCVRRSHVEVGVPKHMQRTPAEDLSAMGAMLLPRGWGHDAVGYGAAAGPLIAAANNADFPPSFSSLKNSAMLATWLKSL